MKKLFFSLLMLLTTSVCLGQSDWQQPFDVIHGEPEFDTISNLSQSCAHSTTEYNNYYNRFDFYLDNYDIRPITTIKINFVIWQQDDGSGNWENIPDHINRLHAIIHHVNTLYKNQCSPSDPIEGVIDLPDTKIRFEIGGIYFIRNSTMYNSNSLSVLMPALATEEPSIQNDLNIHITGASFYATGYARVASYNTNYQQGIFTTNNEHDPSGDWVMGGHLAHELGHTLDLMHTYNTETCDQTDPDYLDDVFGSGANAICHHEAGFSCNPYIQSNTCTNNMMGGTKEACYFSPKQIATMHRALSLMSIRKYVKCESYNAEPILISNNETWDFNIKFYNPLKIKNTAKLTIQCNVLMSNDAKIIVEPGGELNVDGGTITNGCDGLWAGIEVKGVTANHNQSGTIQGTAYFTNATIEHARVAVRNHGMLDNGNTDWNASGGIIIAQSSDFTNNIRSAAFMPYESHNPVNNAVIYDKSFFSSCNFTWDDNFRSTTGNEMVSMYRVNGVHFTGCHFKDDRSNPSSRWIVETSKGNSGIVSADAYYYIYGSHFTNLDFGIWAQNYQTEKHINVRSCTFTNNLYGIELVEVDYPVCFNNTFITDDNNNHFLNYSSTLTGIHAIATNQIRFEENKFHDNSSSAIRTNGIVCSDIGTVDTRTYKNEFYGLEYGTVAQGLNRSIIDFGYTGLYFECNENHGTNYRDHLVLDNLWGGSSNPTYGVKRIFGTNNYPIGNKFTQLNQPNEDFYNKPNSYTLNYWYSAPNATLEEPIQTYNVFKHDVQGITNTCPSKIKVGGGTKPYVSLTATEKAQAVTDFNTASATLTQKKNDLNNLVDGGNTQALLTQVANLTPQNKFQLRQTLLSYSPYVSADVVKATVNNPPNKYPHWWAFELVLANIDVARQPGFMDFLANKQYPMPYWMRWTINWFAQNGGVTPLLEKRSEISGITTQRSLASELLIRDFRQDSTGVKIDSIIYWTEQQADQMYKFRKVDLLLEKGQLEQAQVVLNQIDPDLYPAELKQRAVDMIALKTRIISILAQHGNLASMSKGDHLFFTQMSETAVGSAKYQADGILCFFFDECKAYTLDLPYGNQKVMQEEAPEMPEHELTFKMYPNPANDWVAIELPLEVEGAMITIVDLNGKVILNTQTNIPMFIWTTNNMTEGVYIVNITNLDGTEKIGTQKVVIQH